MLDIKGLIPIISENNALNAAGQAMAELGVAGCIGTACVMEGHLNSDMVQVLAKTSFSILLPMFLFSSLVKTIQTYGIKLSSVSIPIISALHCYGMYLLSSNIILPTFQMNGKSSSGEVTSVVCSWGNCGVLPLIFAESLFRSQPSLLSKAYATISLYIVGWTPFFWSFAKSKIIKSQREVFPDSSNSSITSSRSSSMSLKIKDKIAEVKSILSPPVVGAVLGLAVGMSPLGQLLMNTSSKKAPLSFLYNSVQNLGRAASPISLLVLTASLTLGASSKLERVHDVPGCDENGSMLQRLGCVCTARFIISPLLMLGMLTGLSKINIIGSKEIDPMLWFILLLESAMPPAQNLVTMLHVADKKIEACDMAKFLFLVYVTSMLPVVFIVTMLLRSLNLIN